MASETSKNKLGDPVPVKLFDGDDSELDTIAEETGLNKQTLIRLCVRAGVDLIRKNGYKITLPLDLSSNANHQGESLLEIQKKRKAKQ